MIFGESYRVRKSLMNLLNKRHWQPQKKESHSSIYSINYILSEIFLVCNLTVQLAKSLGSRLAWLWMLVRFFCWVSLITIPLVRAGYIFMISDYILRGIKYGPNARNNLDIYLTSNKKRKRLSKKYNKNKNQTNSIPETDSGSDTENDKYPVVVFLSGGAWIIGYKGWGAFMGMLLAQLGVIFVAPDYRNFPQGNINEMVEDATTAISWVRDNIEQYGGDKNQIYLISQSAGAHISSLTVLLQAYKVGIYRKLKSQLIQLKFYRKQCKLVDNFNNASDDTSANNNVALDDTIHEIEDKLDDYEPAWDPCDLKAFIGIAGPYNMIEMRSYLDSRGLYIDILDKIMNHDVQANSPFHFVFDKFVKKDTDANTHDLRRCKSMSNILNVSNPLLPFVSMTELNVDYDTMNTSLCDTTTDNDDDESSNLLSVSIMEEEDGDIVNTNDNKNVSKCEEIIGKKCSLQLCPMYLFHGDKDESVPVANATTFARVLASYGVETYIKIYANASHTDPIIENPISGHDPLIYDILNVIFPDQSLTNIVDEIENTMRGSINIPKCVISMAKRVCPF